MRQEEFKVGSGRDIGNTHVHSNIIRDSQKVRSTQSPSTDDWINKMWHTHIYPYNELLFSLKRGKEILQNATTWTNLEVLCRVK